MARSCGPTSDTAIPGLARAARASDAMDVDFRLKRQLEVHHQIQPFDVQAARGDVRRHQHADAVIAKFRHHEVALLLFQVAVQAGAADPRRAERLLDPGRRSP